MLISAHESQTRCDFCQFQDCWISRPANEIWRHPLMSHGNIFLIPSLPARTRPLRRFWQGQVNIWSTQAMSSFCRQSWVFALFLLLAGCSALQPGADGLGAGFTETGLASFYADRHQGRSTASGEPYQHALKTAAHKKLPFGSRVKVTNLSNGKSVMVTINDRGPFVKGRIIDLSKSAFSSIGHTSSGLIHVKIAVVR